MSQDGDLLSRSWAACSTYDSSHQRYPTMKLRTNHASIVLDRRMCAEGISTAVRFCQKAFSNEGIGGNTAPLYTAVHSSCPPVVLRLSFSIENPSTAGTPCVALIELNLESLVLRRPSLLPYQTAQVRQYTASPDFFPPHCSRTTVQESCRIIHSICYTKYFHSCL